MGARVRPDARSSQGDRWKTLISKYIVVMLPIGSRPEPEEQSAIGGASLVAIQAMSAKVGEATRATQPVAPRAWRTLALAAGSRSIGPFPAAAVM